MLLILLLFFPLGGRSSSFGAGGNAKGKMIRPSPPAHDLDPAHDPLIPQRDQDYDQEQEQECLRRLCFESRQL
jgi:hypothetical protein